MKQQHHIQFFPIIYLLHLDMIKSSSWISRICASSRLCCNRLCIGNQSNNISSLHTAASSPTTKSDINGNHNGNDEDKMRGHLIIPKAKTSDKLVSIIGDVHGCFDELIEMIAKLNVISLEEKKELQVIFVGDLVGKGPESAKVVNYVRTMTSSLSERERMVRGNHDALLLIYANSEELKNNGSEYGNIAKTMSQEEVNYLQDSVYSLFIEEYNTYVVHAGLKPGTHPIDNLNNDLMTARDVLPNGELTSKPNSEPGSRPWASVWDGPQQVVFGHDAARKLQRYAYATGLDTGCCYGGKLSALILNTNQIIQVDAKKEYKKPGKND